MAERNYSTSRVGLAQALEDAAMRRSSKPNTPLASALNQYAPKPQEAGGLSDGIMSALQSYADEATGAFARYGRRSGAQRDASLAMLNQAVDPNTDPLTGAGMKALGLAGLVTHPLAFFPTREEWDERLTNAGNDGRMSRSIGGFLSDLPSLIDPQMAAGGAALAAAPLLGKIPRQAITDAGVHTGWVLKDVDRGGMLSPSVSKGQMRAINSAMDNGKWSEAEVPIREMYATQSNVNPDFAEAAARHPGDLPLAVRVNGKIYLRDGHHRVVAAANEGKQTAKVRLVDIDNMGNKDDAQGDLLGALGSPSTVSRDQALQGLAGGADAGKVDDVADAGRASAMNKQAFADMSRRGQLRQARTEQQDFDDLIAGKMPANKFELEGSLLFGEDYEMGDFTKRLQDAGLHVDDDMMGNVLAGRDKAAVDALKAAKTPMQFGRSFGYSEDDIARFYVERNGGDVDAALQEYTRDMMQK